MAFWIGIFVAAVFAWFAVKIGFYEIWAMLFNIVISIYLAIRLRPVVPKFFPAAGAAPYSDVLIIVAIALGVFLILHGITYVFLTSQFAVPFPKLFDILGAGVLGFLTGFLVWGLVNLLISITPISQYGFVKEIGFGRQQASMSGICWWGDLIDNMVSSDNKQHTTEEVINKLIEDVEKKSKPKTSTRTEPNEPADSNEATEDIGEDR